MSKETRTTPNDRETVAGEVGKLLRDTIEFDLCGEAGVNATAVKLADFILTREAVLREQLVAQARAAEQWRRHAQLVEKSENHTRAERGHLRSLLTRCLTELDGDEMDKVRGALLAEIAQALP